MLTLELKDMPPQWKITLDYNSLKTQAFIPWPHTFLPQMFSLQGPGVRGRTKQHSHVKSVSVSVDFKGKELRAALTDKKRPRELTGFIGTTSLEHY